MTAGLKGGEWLAARHGRTLASGKTRYPFYRRLGRPQGRSGLAKYLVLTGLRSRSVQPIVSRYTDWATGPTEHKYVTIIYRKLQKYSPSVSGIFPAIFISSFGQMVYLAHGFLFAHRFRLPEALGHVSQTDTCNTLHFSCNLTHISPGMHEKYIFTIQRVNSFNCYTNHCTYIKFIKFTH